MKKRMAVWIYGGIGTGHFSQGYPALEKLLDGLSVSFEIVIYSKFSTNKDYHSTNFIIRSAPVNIKFSMLRWLYMIIYFLRDHRHNKFHLLLAFWGYPSGFIATCLSKIINIPCAVYALGSDSFGIESINFGILHRPLLRRIVLWTYKHTNLLLGISDFQKKNLELHGIKNVTIIPWGIEKSSYKFFNKKREPTLRIIHVGHLTPVKDQVTLLKAFALINKKQPSELRIYGVDRMNGTLQRMAKELGTEKEVQFLDIAPYHKMPVLYTWADIMLHTSIVEGQSMALTEAAASGVLIAGTNVGLLHDLGEDYGIIVEVGDFEELARKVLNILGNSEGWNKKIENSRQWAEQHDLNWTVNKLITIFNSLLSNSRGN